MERFIFHIDVNSAYLSWSAVEKLKNGADVDLREIPSIIGGDIKSRHGVVLAKSIPAKAYGVKTGEPVSHALNKCPHLVSEPPDHRLYSKYSKQLMALLVNFCPNIEQVSVDECYMDATDTVKAYASPVEAAVHIKDTVYDTFGYTVNIGISSNKLLAKMASDFQKPNKVHTLFPNEVPQKMWPLPVSELYMVGKSSVHALEKLDIHTIGELAVMDVNLLVSHMKSHGRLIWEFANGLDDSPVQVEESESKCVGNSTTLPQDAETSQDAKKVLLSLCEQVSQRLKNSGHVAGMVSTELKYATFVKVSHQTQLTVPTNDPKLLYAAACRLFDELWNKEPIRLLGVRTSKLTKETSLDEIPKQLSIFDIPQTRKEQKAEKVLKELQERFGPDIIKKGL